MNIIRPLESGLAETSGDDLDRALGRQHLLSFVDDFVGPALLAIGAATAIGWRGAFWITTAALALFTITTGPFLLLAGAIGTAAAREPIGAAAAMVLVGVGTAIVWTMVHERMLTVVPDRSATVSSAVSTLAVVGAVIPAAVGWVADRSSLGVGLWMLVALAVLLIPVIGRAVHQAGFGARPGVLTQRGVGDELHP